MGTHSRLIAVLFVSLFATFANAATAKKPVERGNADAGRNLALEACTGCHVVSDNQPFPPLLKVAPNDRRAAASAAERADGEPSAHRCRTRRRDGLHHDPAGTSRKSPIVDPN